MHKSKTLRELFQQVEKYGEGFSFCLNSIGGKSYITDFDGTDYEIPNEWAILLQSMYEDGYQDGKADSQEDF